ncbi:MAG: DUF2950 domain-containing protein [Methyloceanibacter sp.]|jgi:hypothetical protein
MGNGIYSVRPSSWLRLFGAALLFSSTAALAQEQFDSPDAAVTALVSAAKQGNESELLKILGPEGDDVISSGDEVADSTTRDNFVASYEEKHSLELEGNGTTTLIMGNDDWPFPIPIANKGGKWEFDTAAGRDEILLRRIGRNELAAIQVSLAYVAAQNDYAALDVDGLSPPPYAQRIVSSAGKKDGLYWPSTEGDDASPLGRLLAEASAEGYEFGDTPTPYHGYYYRILKRQGADANGGAFDYVVNGRMIGGFGLLAYPAEYGNSGIMTFMVNHDGVVFQKDLGPETSDHAPNIETFLPDGGWTKVDAP